MCYSSLTAFSDDKQFRFHSISKKFDRNELYHYLLKMLYRFSITWKREIRLHNENLSFSLSWEPKIISGSTNLSFSMITILLLTSRNYRGSKLSDFLIQKIKNYLFVWTAIIVKSVDRFRRVRARFKEHSATLPTTTKKL